jgi:phosphomannomutase
LDLKENLKGLTRLSAAKRVDWRLVITLGLFGVVLVTFVGWQALTDWRLVGAESRAIEQKQQAMEQLHQPIQTLKRVMADDQVQILAVRALDNPATTNDLFSYINGRIGQVQSVDVYPADVSELRAGEIGPNGFAVLDMILSTLEGSRGLMQIHHVLKPPRLYDAGEIRAGDEVVGVMVLSLDPEFLMSGFNPDFSSFGYLRLTQFNGRAASNHLSEWGDAGLLGDVPDRLSVPGTRFRLEFPGVAHVRLISPYMMILMLLAGLLCIIFSVVLFRKRRHWEIEHPAKKPAKPPARTKALRKPAVLKRLAGKAEDEVAGDDPLDHEFEKIATDTETEEVDSTSADPDELPEPPPMHLHYDVAERRKMRESEHSPVELRQEIFRAYDIRGVIDKTLDSGVARKIGQAVGTVALEREAAPVVVARDGRLSGPYLMEGMLEGITSTGCDVLDIGAVPTGVLYYAAHEMASGSGVMITGSHNPPDYNGFKIMVGGDTLHGEEIAGLYTRISVGELRSGQGSIARKNVVPDYIKRISDDIKMERDLKIVIDCGNGIGGVCAAETLRAIGAEVLPLFDEVDGTFPNHHPDPSDPENLEDLIASVRLMDADLGLALDGDADRLGVVTLAGNIIYPDRVMMLLALDVLDRNPGATIIYDVKCTGHLPKVIEEAGGNPVMYKTGHSLIKARMKEIGSPFAGEMSGHFFFEERWYGVDDGIYAAARLLEILSSTETPPEAILNALPTSFSTPELKVQMQEGENHGFIESFKAAANFDDANISTIDGLRADYDDGWGLVRASNTTPILVVRFDAETEEALERIKTTFRMQMLAVKPDLDLPF